MFLVVAVALALLATLVPGLIVVLVRLLLRRPVRGLLGWLFWSHVVLLALHLFVSFPCFVGFVGSRWIGTRPDERAYVGPNLLPDGSWLIQQRGQLIANPDGAVTHRIRSADGTQLRLFHVPNERPVAEALLVHGLFRGALELETVGDMLRRHGCSVWLLELRNHGGSDRAPATYGLRESEDVLAAVATLRSDRERAARPLLVFGVSLGTVAVALAAPRIERLDALVLDAPIEDLTAAADRMLGFHREGDRRNFFRLVEPWRSLVVHWLGWWSSFEPGRVTPIHALQDLSAGLPVLVIGAGDDDRAPPDRVQALFDSLPQLPGTKELWLQPGAGHGQVWAVDPRGYEKRLAALLARIAGRR